MGCRCVLSDSRFSIEQIGSCLAAMSLEAGSSPGPVGSALSACLIACKMCF